MRIAYLCSDPGIPVYGSKGASIHVRELSGALQRLGHDVTIFAARGGGEPPWGYDVPVVAVEPDPLDELLLGLLRADPCGGKAVAHDVRSVLAAVSLHHRTIRLMRESAADLVYERSALFGTAGLAVARALGVPLILEVNAPLSEEQERHRELAYRKTASELEQTVARSADHVLAVSSLLGRRLVAAGVPAKRVTVLANAVDPERFEDTGVAGDALRARLGLANSLIVGFLGTLKPWHDVATVVRAVARLRRNGTMAPHLLVVGDGPEREALEELARSEGIGDAATFAGSVPHADVASYLGAFDVAVVPYERIPSFYFSPLKLFEYLAAGRPVIAADVGDIGHCIRHGETGFLYPAGETEALAGAIEVLLADRPRARRLARAGQEHVRTHHTWERNAKRVVELADDLLSRKPAGAFA
jgi:glycosyltransferase involved in cell wall biosynthesis